MKNLIITGLITICSMAIVSCEEPHLVVGAQLSTPVYERPISPDPDYVWIDGDWVTEGGHYVWHNGYWSRPHRNRYWETGRWEERNNGWSWRRGHWH